MKTSNPAQNERRGRMSTWKFVVTICFSVFLQGIDYGIVMPSMLAYMTSKDSDPEENKDWLSLFFGITLSAFSLASLVTAPIFGMWYDRRPMKEVALFLSFLALGGSMMYALAVANWMILVGRIICGMAYNIFTGANVYVIRTTSISERSGLFTKITMAFAIGTALGPAINFPLSKIGDYYFGPFEFSANSSPGFLMAALFFLNALTFMFLFEEPIFVPEAEGEKANRTCLQEWLAIFSKFSCVVLIITQFLVIFTQSTVEVLVTPQTHQWYDFDPFQNSLLFTGMTVVVVLAIVAVGFMVKWFQDRSLLMMGHTLVGAGTVVFVIFLVLSPENRTTFFIPIWQFCFVCALYVAAIAFYQTVLGSLFSKLLDDPPLEGRGQSVMGSASAAGAIVGPIISTILLPHGILYVPAVVGVMWGFVLFLLLISWHKMYVHEPIVAEVEADETKGLIGINTETQEERGFPTYTAPDQKA